MRENYRVKWRDRRGERMETEREREREGHTHTHMWRRTL